MAKKPTYEELVQRVQALEKESLEHKERVETLRAGEEGLRGLLENMMEGVAVYQARNDCEDFVFVDLNQAGEKISKISKEAVIGKSVLEAFPGIKDFGLFEVLQRVWRTGKLERHPVGLYKDDRISHWVENAVYKSPSGEIVAVYNDKTDRKLAEYALEQKITELNSFINNIPDMAWVKDADSRFIAANNAFGETVGMEPNSLINQTCEVCFGKEEARKFKEDDQNVIKSGKQEIIEERIVDSQQNQIWLETIKSPMMDDSGKVIGTVGIARDVSRRKRAEEALEKLNLELEEHVEQRTAELSRANEQLQQEIAERRQAEDALRESEEKYRTILENIEDGYYEVDIEGNFTFFNDSMWKIIGYPKNELMGMNFKRYNVQEDIQQVYETFNKVYRTGKPAKIMQHRIIRNDGTKRYVELSASLIKDAESQPIGFRGILRDVTELRRLEAHLQQAQRLEAIGTLAGGIAHDFNNLLMGIQGNASLILLEKDSGHPDIERLRNIEQYVQNGADLSKQLIGFAMSGKYEVKPIDLNELIKKSSVMFGRTKKEIDIYRNYQEGIWSAEVDQGQIEQVLLNLYVNAWQAMPAGGELHLKTENVTLDEAYTNRFEAKPGNYVMITVADTGVGMDETAQQRIFEPFFTTKEMGRGTGLGLASVYGIIKNHGGFIDVYSEKSKGAIFNIYLPASKKAAVREKELIEEIIKGTENILLVDDDPMIVDIGEQLLKKMGYEVLTAKSGKEAIKIYEENKGEIGMVILDMVMPGMGGGETYDKLKDLDPHIKVLLSSGYSIDGEAQEILDRGCNGFIQKPFRIKDLSQKLRMMLDKI